MAKEFEIKSLSQSVTYEATGTLDEDVSDIITNISPDKTPFLSQFTRGDQATELKFDWFNERLAPPKVNAFPEMDDYKTEKVGGLTRSANHIQFFQNSGKVSDAMRQTKKLYNQQDEFSRQAEKAMREHALDIEYAIAKNATSRPERGSAVALTGGIPFFLAEETLVITINTATGEVSTGTEEHGLLTGDFVLFQEGTGGVLPTELLPNERYYVNVTSTTEFKVYDSLDDAIKDNNALTFSTAGTAPLNILLNNVIDAGDTALTEAQINDAMSLTYYRGGNPTLAVMSGRNKRRFTEVLRTTNQTQRQQSDTRVDNVVTTYQSDFGQIDAMAHLMYDDKSVHLLDMNYWAHRWFNPPHRVADLAKRGSYTEFVIESQYGLQGTQPYASAAINNLKGR